MATTELDRPDVAAILADLQRQRDALDPQAAETAARAEADAIAIRANTLDSKMDTIRSTTLAIRATDAKIAAEEQCREFLTQSRTTIIQTELEALPPRIRDAKTLGVFQNLTLSLKMIAGEPIVNLFGFELRTLRIGHLAVARYGEGPKIENQTYGAVPWRGSLKDVEARLTKLRLERDEAQHRLAAALATDADRDKQQAAIAEKNAAGQLKIRGDGSKYRKLPDGTILELDEVTT